MVFLDFLDLKCEILGNSLVISRILDYSPNNLPTDTTRKTKEHKKEKRPIDKKRKRYEKNAKTNSEKTRFKAAHRRKRKGDEGCAARTALMIPSPSEKGRGSRLYIAASIFTHKDYNAVSECVLEKKNVAIAAEMRLTAGPAANIAIQDEREPSERSG